MSNKQTEQRSSTIALIGAPNVGKSTLLNHLLETKVSIVSKKVQTTRTFIRGIFTQDEAQLVFVDTPGIFLNPKRSLEKAIVNAAWRGLEEADQIALLVDATDPLSADAEYVIKSLKKRQIKNVLLIVNKVDKVPKDELLPLLETLQSEPLFKEIFLISALKNDGVVDVRNFLLERAPLNRWMFPEDQVSDAPIRFLATEITREKAFRFCHQELPYALMVDTEKWEEEEGKLVIHQLIYVMKESQKKILIGNKGSMIKKIGQSARHELSEILDKKVNLFLFVKVREKWQENPSLYNVMGLELPK